VLTSSENDSLRWQLALPESRGEDFLREFCTAMESQRPSLAWIVRAGSAESFSPLRTRIRSTESLMVRNGMMSGHLLLVDTLGLDPAQMKAAREFNGRQPIERSLVFTGNELTLPPLPVGVYRVFCTFHSKSVFDDLFVEVVASPRSPQGRQPAPSARPPQASARP
jgi:hypothetical protein